ncbi:MAG: hypothetical protein F6K11_02275 [Leptolyngbya sp. SIO3F4]|nr:hypothetical protein [Leptolyngbya sp. SIO3F4]
MMGKFYLTGFGYVFIGAIALTACQELSQLTAPSYESQLAEYLSNTDAKMYGAYWCPHCARQKNIFGNAAPLIPYIECDARGVNPQVDLCNAVGINAYPTWQINGQFYLGAQSLKRLAILSGFEEDNDQTDIGTGEWGNFSPAR